MDSESQTVVQEKIKNLPAEIRDMLASDVLSQKIREIGNKRHLHIDQIGAMEDEVVMTMIGLSESTELSKQLAEQLNVSAADADALVDDINTSVFIPIQDSMKKQADEKSVVMPSSIAAKPVLPPVAPAATPAPVTPTAPLSNQISPAPKPEINAPPKDAGVPLDIMLSQPTISMPKKVETTPSISSGQAATPVSVAPAPATPAAAAKVEPPKPAPIYKADPYREPIE